MNLNEKAMLVHLRLSMWTGRTKDSLITEEVIRTKNSDSDAGAWWTYLVPKKDIKKIENAAARCRTEFFKITLPWMDGGMRILPSAMFLTYSQTMRQAVADYENAIKEFVDNYPTIISEAKRRLGKLAEQKNLPTVEDIKNRFSAKLNVLPLPTANDFRVSLNRDEVETIKKNITANIEAMTSKAMDDLWNRLILLVDKVENTMRSDDKIFRDTLIGNLKDFCELIPKMNLTNDKHLEEIRKEVVEKLANLKPNDLREDKAQRKTAHKAAKSVLEKIKEYKL